MQGNLLKKKKKKTNFFVEANPEETLRVTFLQNIFCLVSKTIRFYVNAGPTIEAQDDSKTTNGK